jgi:hypothetical protein
MNQRNDRSLLAGLLILFAMATRVAFNELHFYNFTAIMASGLFAGAYLSRNKEAGLLQCYTEGLPFYRNTLLGDITWSAVLFGSYELFRLRTPKAQLASKRQLA